MLKTILYLFVAFYLVVFGILAIIRPERVRDFYVRQYTKGLGSLTKSGDLSGLERFIPRASVFRVFGITSLVASGLIVYSLFRG